MTMGIIYFPFRMLGRADTEWPRGEKPLSFFRTGFRRNTSKKGIDKLCAIWYNIGVRKRGKTNEDVCNGL
jgi:hypothetical protein